MSRARSALLVLEETTAGATADGSVIHRLDILKCLLDQDVNQENLEGIEYVSPTKWFIVFKTEYLRAAHLGFKIETKGYTGTLVHPFPPKAKPNKPKYTHVHVTGYPLDSDTGVLMQAMRFYGTIKEIKELVDSSCDMKTGVRDVVFSVLAKPIASYIYAGKYQVRCNYTGQTQTCRKCHRTGHIARECTATNVCRACGEEGHQKGTCPNLPCYYCQEVGHLQKDCPQYQSDFPGMDTTPAPESEDTPAEDTNADDEWQPTPWIEPGQDPNVDPFSWGPPDEQHNPPKEPSTVPETPPDKPDQPGPDTNQNPDPPEPSTPSTTDQAVASAISNPGMDPPHFKPPYPQTPKPTTAERQRTPLTSPCSSATVTPTPSGDESSIDEMETDSTKRGAKRPAGQASPKGRKTKIKSKRHMKISQAKNRSPFTSTTKN